LPIKANIIDGIYTEMPIAIINTPDTAYDAHGKCILHKATLSTIANTTIEHVMTAYGM
jgi:hypothetical protein